MITKYILKHSIFSLAALVTAASLQAQGASIALPSNMQIHNDEYVATFEAEQPFYSYKNGLAYGSLLNREDFTVFRDNDSVNIVLDPSMVNKRKAIFSLDSIAPILKEVKANRKNRGYVTLTIRLMAPYERGKSSADLKVLVNGKPIISKLDTTIGGYKLHKTTFPINYLKDKNNIMVFKIPSSTLGAKHASIKLDKFVLAFKEVTEPTKTIAREAEPRSPAGDSNANKPLDKIVETGVLRGASEEMGVYLKANSNINDISYDITDVAKAALSARRPLKLQVRYVVNPNTSENPASAFNVLVNKKVVKTNVKVLSDRSDDAITYTQRPEQDYFFSIAELEIPKSLLNKSQNIITFEANKFSKQYGRIQQVESIFLDSYTFFVNDLTKIKPKNPTTKRVALLLQGESYKGDAEYVIKYGDKFITGTVGAKQKRVPLDLSYDNQTIEIFFTNDLYHGKNKDRSLAYKGAVVDGKKQDIFNISVSGCRWNKAAKTSATLNCGDKK